jgi:hypothetical protein
MFWRETLWEEEIAVESREHLERELGLNYS